MGWANPLLIKQVICEVQAAFPRKFISLHLHDTRGCGIANVYSALEMGINCFDSSLGGMGGCPFARGAAGNVATEDLVYLCEDMGISTGVNLEQLVKAAKLAEDIVGCTLTGKYYKSLS